MGTLGRRALLSGISAAIGLGVGRWYLQPQNAKGPKFPVFDSFAAAEGRVLNDASELSPTSVASHVTINSGLDNQYTNRIRALLDTSIKNNRPFVANTARHSMGGQSLAENGTILTLSQTWLEADTAAKTYRVAAGTRWSTVIAELDKIGFSPAVMQSNNDFGVGSSFCVNAHGWPVPFGGCGSTVRSLRLMLADGNVITCSRTSNAELFNHAMGGYGLFGIITDLELDMVPNARLVPTYQRMPGAEVGQRFADALASDPAIQMAYGRLDVSLDRFFEDGMLITYRPSPDQSNLPPASGSSIVSHIAGSIFRAQVESDFAKHMRWWTETSLGPAIIGQSTRNSLMNEPAITFNDGDADRTDILHEYFVPPNRFGDFVAQCREVIPASYQQLLNVTVRYVNADADSVLAYAPTPRIASVMLFSQEKTERGEADMARMTHALIERVIAIGGSYYLPYRLHASQDQVIRAYPRAAEFAARKREIDKGLVFRNLMWDRYFATL